MESSPDRLFLAKLKLKGGRVGQPKSETSQGWSFGDQLLETLRKLFMRGSPMAEGGNVLR